MNLDVKIYLKPRGQTLTEPFYSSPGSISVIHNNSELIRYVLLLIVNRILVT